MKKIFLIAFGLLLAASLHKTAAYSAPSVTENLVAAYDFNEDASDISGNGNDCMVGGGVTASEDRFGETNAAFSFDGLSGYLDCGTLSTTLYILGDVTVSAWVKLDAHNVAIIAGFLANGETEETNQVYSVFLLGNGSTQIGHEYGSGSNSARVFPTALNIGEWYHIAAVRKTTDLQWRLFLNSVQFGSVYTYPANATGGTEGHAYIGGNNTGGYFDGVIDDVRIYDRALSDEEILALYNETIAPVYFIGGFEDPLAKGPVKVKKKRVLPIKSELQTSEGTVLTDSDITAPPVIQVLYRSIVTPDPIDVSDLALSAGMGTEGNQFVFTDENKWQFNLKTSNFTSPGTYSIHIFSGDDAEYAIDQSYTPAVFVLN